MNMDNVYKIKKSLKTPMITATLISIPVFADVIMRGFKLSTMIMVLGLMILFYILTLNNILRKVRISDTGITIRGILGIRRLPLENITMIDGMTMGSRQFATIATKKGSYLIPNSFDNFSSIISDLDIIASEGKKGAGLIQLKGNIIMRRSDIAGAWITVILLLIILLIRFYPK
jgi:hypothetical protein